MIYRQGDADMTNSWWRGSGLQWRLGAPITTLYCYDRDGRCIKYEWRHWDGSRWFLNQLLTISLGS